MTDAHWLIVYDIRDSRRLRKVEKCMNSYAHRVQNSVFEATANTQVIARLKERLTALVAEEDFVLFFKVCEKDWQKQEVYGRHVSDDEKMKDDSFLVL